MRRLPILLLLAALAWVPARAADDLANAQRLWLAGQKTQAVDQVEQALTRTPDDLQLRFALGVMRMELGDRPKAMGIFTRLTQDFPDLADPYNNLAVLYAGQGQYDKARAALEAAVRGNPNYATAYENLGDYGRAAKCFEQVLAFEGHPLYFEAQDGLDRVKRGAVR